MIYFNIDDRNVEPLLLHTTDTVLQYGLLFQFVE